MKAHVISLSRQIEAYDECVPDAAHLERLRDLTWPDRNVAEPFAVFFRKGDILWFVCSAKSPVRYTVQGSAVQKVKAIFFAEWRDYDFQAMPDPTAEIVQSKEWLKELETHRRDEVVAQLAELWREFRAGDKQPASTTAKVPASPNASAAPAAPGETVPVALVSSASHVRPGVIESLASAPAVVYQAPSKTVQYKGPSTLLLALLAVAIGGVVWEHWRYHLLESRLEDVRVATSKLDDLFDPGRVTPTPAIPQVPTPEFEEWKKALALIRRSRPGTAEGQGSGTSAPLISAHDVKNLLLILRDDTIKKYATDELNVSEDELKRFEDLPLALHEWRRLSEVVEEQQEQLSKLLVGDAVVKQLDEWIATAQSRPPITVEKWQQVNEAVTAIQAAVKGLKH